MNASFETLRPLILASSSPRRHAFFHEQGLEFTPLVPHLPEDAPEKDENPATYALRTAKAKATEVMTIHGRVDSRAVIIAADTIVTLTIGSQIRILGKPATPGEALDMLKSLSGRTHEVITACCLMCADGPDRAFVDRATVRFAPWPDEVLAAYVACKEPMDKAGAYGIQGKGAFLVEGIEGAWTTVVGLPLHQLLQNLMELGAIRPRPVL